MSWHGETRMGQVHLLIPVSYTHLDVYKRQTNRHAMAIGGNTGGSFVVAVQSSRDDTLFQATFNVLGDAARRQLTGRRAGVLIAGLHGLGPDQLMSVAGQDHTPGEPPTALAWNVSDFLSSSARSHLVGLGFLSRSAMRTAAAGHLTLSLIHI